MIKYLLQKWDGLKARDEARQDLAAILDEEIFAEELTELQLTHLDMDDTHNFVDPKGTP